MSYAIDAATRLHQRQIEAATQVQDLFIKAVGALAALREKAPQPPERVAAPLAGVAAPVAKVVGTPREIATYLGQSRRDWQDLRKRFQEKVGEFNQAQPGPEGMDTAAPVSTPAPTTATTEASPTPKATALKATKPKATKTAVVTTL